MDFTDKASIDTSLKITEEMRAERREDVLQLKTVLWHAWHSLERFESLPNHVHKGKDFKAINRRKSTSGRNSQANRDAEKKKTRMGQEKYDAAFNLSCPHPGCVGMKKKFTKGGLLDHM